MKGLVEIINRETERVFIVGVQLKGEDAWCIDESLDESLDAVNDETRENGARSLRSVRVETDAPLVWTTDATRARRLKLIDDTAGRLALAPAPTP